MTKIIGVVIILLGIMLAYVGVTGTQHNLMNILKHLGKTIPSKGPTQSYNKAENVGNQAAEAAA